jgi:hypothetical protein
MCIFLSCPWLISLTVRLKSIFFIGVLLLATIMGYAAETISSSSLKFRPPFFFFYPEYLYMLLSKIMGSYLKNLNALRDDMMELKPTLLVGVPRVFERVHEGMGASHLLS